MCVRHEKSKDVTQKVAVLHPTRTAVTHSVTIATLSQRWCPGSHACHHGNAPSGQVNKGAGLICSSSSPELLQGGWE